MTTGAAAEPLPCGLGRRQAGRRAGNEVTWTQGPVMGMWTVGPGTGSSLGRTVVGKAAYRAKRCHSCLECQPRRASTAGAVARLLEESEGEAKRVDDEEHEERRHSQQYSKHG